jgi:H+/Cl- antiporter ClcA
VHECLAQVIFRAHASLSGIVVQFRHLISFRHWKARILMWSAAAAVGGAAVGFAKVADLAQLGLRRLLGISTAIPWLLAPLGFCAIAWLTRRYFKGAEGSGIPQTIFAIRPESGELFLKPKVVIGRVALAGAALLCGGSIGREGPTVHVGAVIVHAVSRWMPKGRIPAQRHAMVLAGGAAGVAAAFNTPLAGIVFAIEELSRSFEERASGTTLTTVILAGVVAIVLVGDYTYFGQPQVASQATLVTPAVLLVAALCGLGGGIFSRLTLASANRLPSPLQRLRSERPALFAALCGLGVAALGAASGALTYGTGYEEAARSSKTTRICRGCTRRPGPPRRYCPI